MQILQAANECFSQLGIPRTSVQDVARMAGVSRGTVYRYFDDRDALITAAIDYGGQQYYRSAAEAMKKKRSLAEQAGAMAQAVAEILVEHRTRNRLLSDDAVLIRHIIADSEDAIRRTTAFLVPYVEAAKGRGEVAASLDVRAASEWLTRIIYSLSTVTSSPTFDVGDPRTVGRFVARYAVNGLR